MQPEIELSVPLLFRGRARYHYAITEPRPTHWSLSFRIYKAGFDVVLSLLVLPQILALALLLLVLNPFFNPGPLFFVQDRLGQHRKPFRLIKFRTMTCTGSGGRSANDGLEHHRVTPLGRLLRASRLDELPNFFNVLKGEMSVIGPRPDARDHAEQYLTEIPHYAYRYLVKPGITGLAQIEAGYAEGMNATSRKAHFDQAYVETSCCRLDVYIACQTVVVMMFALGAK